MEPVARRTILTVGTVEISLVQIRPDTVLWLVEIKMLIRQLSYATENQLKAPKAPYLGILDEMPPTRGISCLSLVIYGKRVASILSMSTYHSVFIWISDLEFSTLTLIWNPDKPL